MNTDKIGLKFYYNNIYAHIKLFEMRFDIFIYDD